VRSARKAAGLTQRELAERLGTTQPAVAQLESARSNPRISTLTRALKACGEELLVTARPADSNIDETLVAQRLRLSPGERIQSFDRVYADVRKLALAGRRARGELA
jgi:transcriptional regulator with XRE-family HTH domain